MENDLILCREILLIKPYAYKSGTKESGAAWTMIANDLNSVREVKFQVTQKSVRDRCKLLIDKFKRQMREEEGASGIVVEPKEIDTLLREIKEESDVAAENYTEMNKQKQKDIENNRERAEEIRTVAMENLSTTQKRKNDESPTGVNSKKRTGSETMSYLMNKLENDNAIKKEELELKKQSIDVELTRQNNFALLLNQQQQQIQQQNERINQQNEIMLRLLETLAKK